MIYTAHLRNGKSCKEIHIASFKLKIVFPTSSQLKEKESMQTTNLKSIGFAFGDLILHNAAINYIPCEFVRILPIINQTKINIQQFHLPL